MKYHNFASVKPSAKNQNRLVPKTLRQNSKNLIAFAGSKILASLIENRFRCKKKIIKH